MLELDEYGYDIVTGFNKKGIHKDTQTRYDSEGYDDKGYNKDGYDKYGFNMEGINEYTGTKYDLDGFDKDRYNERGFNAVTKKHRYTKKVYDEKGFNIKGLWHGTNKYSSDTGYDVNGFNIEGIHEETLTKYNLEGYDVDGYNEYGYNRDGYDRLGINNLGINIQTAEKDKRIVFAEEFISSGKSIEKFAEDKQISLQEARDKLEEVRKCAFIKEEIEDALEKNSIRFVRIMKNKKEQLLSGEITIKEIKGIDIIFSLSTPEEKEKIIQILVKEFVTHSISIFEYRDIFGIQNLDSRLPKEITKKINSINIEAKKGRNKDIRLISKDMYKEVDRINTYATPYLAREGEQLGYMENPGDTEPKMVAITDEYREMAREYLIATDEFICNRTMKTALMQIIKGKLDIQKLNRLKAEKELRTLKQQDEELDEITELAEEVIGRRNSKERE